LNSREMDSELALTDIDSGSNPASLDLGTEGCGSTPVRERLCLHVAGNESDVGPAHRPATARTGRDSAGALGCRADTNWRCQAATLPVRTQTSGLPSSGWPPTRLSRRVRLDCVAHPSSRPGARFRCCHWPERDGGDGGGSVGGHLAAISFFSSMKYAGYAAWIVATTVIRRPSRLRRKWRTAVCNCRVGGGAEPHDSCLRTPGRLRPDATAPGRAELSKRARRGRRPAAGEAGQPSRPLNPYADGTGGIGHRHGSQRMMPATASEPSPTPTAAGSSRPQRRPPSTTHP
jgi:hypothetical protein